MSYETTLSVRRDETLRIAVYGGPLEGRIEVEGSATEFDLIREEWQVRSAGHGENPLTLREVRAFGRAFGEALLPPEIRRALLKAREVCLERDARLRLRVVADREMEIPFECLDLGAQADPLALDAMMRVHRAVERRAVSERIGRAGEGLRVLIAYANPSTPAHPRLGWVEEEVQAVAAAAGVFADVQIVPDAVPSTIQRAIRRHEPHVFHFSGHAEQRPTGDALITLGHREGSSELRAETLGRWLAEAGTRLAVLIACDSAGFARELVAAGVGAAIGMQMPVRPGAPLVLSPAIYRSLAYGATYDEAVAQARQSARDLSGDWLAPTLYGAETPGRLRTPPPTQARPVTPNNLSTRERRLVGRTSELWTIRKALVDDGRRLVAITGSGGVGKTRLATAVGEELLGYFPDGVWFVPVPENATPESLFNLLGAVPALQGASRNPRFLIILDGCERTTATGALEALETFLDAMPGATVLATGRDSVRFGDAHEIRLRPLEVSRHGALRSDAIDLFLQTAADALPDFHVTAEEASVVRDICLRLDGHPLSLVLAASRLRHVSLLDLADILNEAPLLTLIDHRRSGDHGSIRQVVETTLRGLGADDKRFLWQLCVFEGEFGFADPNAVFGIDRFTVIDGLSRLRDRSLVESFTRNGRTRYRLLDPIRTAIQESLGEGQWAEWQSARRAHAVHYADVAARNEAPAGDMSNLRAGLAYAIETEEGELIASFAASLSRPLLESGFWTDLDGLLEASFRVSQTTGDLALESRMLGIRGALRARRGDSPGSLADWERRAAICAEIEDGPGRADALIDIACRDFWTNDPALVDARLDRALSAAWEAEMPELIASGCVLRGLLYQRKEDSACAVTWAERAAQVDRTGRPKDPWLFVDTNLGRLFVFAEQIGRAEGHYRAALREARMADRYHHIAGALCGLSTVYERANRPCLSARCALASKALYSQLGSAWKSKAEERLARLRTLDSAAVSLAEATEGGWAVLADELISTEMLDPDS